MNPQLPVPIKARPPTSATRQQQKIRMIKQCCAVFNRHIPATENTWRPRKEGESHEEYRLRVVERGDGDLFRAWQIMEAALEERSRRTFALVARQLPAAQRRALEADRRSAAVVRDDGGQHWRLGHCGRCQLRMAVPCAEGAAPVAGCCDICETVARENEVWAPHMPCKELSKKRKKKKKKKKRKAAELLPTPEELLAMHTARLPAAPAKKPCPGLGGEVLLGMDLQPEQTLRPTLQRL
jgi:hypothetical protein